MFQFFAAFFNNQATVEWRFCCFNFFVFSVFPFFAPSLVKVLRQERAEEQKTCHNALKGSHGSESRTATHAGFPRPVDAFVCFVTMSSVSRNVRRVVNLPPPLLLLLLHLPKLDRSVAEPNETKAERSSQKRGGHEGERDQPAGGLGRRGEGAVGVWRALLFFVYQVCFSFIRAR